MVVKYITAGGKNYL